MQIEAAARRGKKGGKAKDGAGPRRWGFRPDQKRDPGGSGRWVDEGKGGDQPFSERGYRRLAERPDGSFIVIDRLSPRTLRRFGARSADLRLSSDDARKQRKLRPDGQATDYRRARDLAETGELRQDGNGIVAFGLSDGDLWHAAFRVTAKGETYLKSLRPTNPDFIRRLLDRSKALKP